MPGIARALALALLSTVGSIAAVAATPPPVKHGSLVIEQPWSRATPPGARMAAGYFLVRNTGPEADELIAASSPRAARVEIHRTIEEGGMSRMRPVPSVTVAAGQSVKAEPGGLHLMFMAIPTPFQEGERVPVTLTFRRAGEVRLEFEVAPIGAQSPRGAAGRTPADGHAGHAHHH